ncbi:DsbA family protein [Ectothiorhodospiraceae bacterium WFHF3C12]|nr:DsbA family protein [Ectothiorhodospiraceae bacterium WFHF3C12]
MNKPVVTVYTDYKSPYAFVANQSIYEIERDFDIDLDWLPYCLDIADYLGSVENRTEHHWRKVRYAYMDARRLANKQGLTLKGPKRIFSGYYSSVGLLFAKKKGFFRSYNDAVFEMFWRHELDIDDINDMANLIKWLGHDAEAYRSYAEGEGKEEHDAIRNEAEELGVFGVPSFLFDGELFWGGDRVLLLRERLQERGLFARKYWEG